MNGLIRTTSGRIAGSWDFWIADVDGFGSSRVEKSGFVRVNLVKNVADDYLVFGNVPHELQQISDIYVICDKGGHGGKVRCLMAFADFFGWVVDHGWPVVYRPGTLSEAQGRLIRVVRRVPAHYLKLLQKTDVDQQSAAVIAALEEFAKDELSNCVYEGTFGSKYKVRHVDVVGSTSRRTYIQPVVDFDLVVETESGRDKLVEDDIRALVGEFMSRVRVSNEVKTYEALLRRETGVTGELQVEEAFVEFRGAESFVVGFDIVARDRAYHFIDITVGRLPQLIGYEIWIQRYLSGLRAADRVRVEREVRLAKALIKKMGLYGSSIGGFRGHIIEQFVIQGHNYRSGGTVCGSIANSFEMIIEESHGDPGNLRFGKYKDKFPLWHPGWWVADVGFIGNEMGVNLWDLIGNGNAVAAESKWIQLYALAVAHDRVYRHDLACTIDSIVTSARGLVAQLKGC